jgi:Raf kinase inhibitor-like YbhB/YbcL family protein
MRIHSTGFEHGGRLPAHFALGAPDGFGGNRNPALAWEGAPAGTQSFVLLCIDTDAPTDPSLAGAEGVEIPVEHPRGDFAHWVMVDIPAGTTAIAEGEASDGVVQGGKATPPGPAGSRQGLNDYTGWFAGQAGMAGRWHGYDGPYPPPNDLRPHRYFFRVFALDTARLDVADGLTAGDVLRAMQGHVLAEAATWGWYALHPAARMP